MLSNLLHKHFVDVIFNFKSEDNITYNLPIRFFNRNSLFKKIMKNVLWKNSCSFDNITFRNDKKDHFIEMKMPGLDSQNNMELKSDINANILKQDDLCDNRLGFVSVNDNDELQVCFSNNPVTRCNEPIGEVIWEKEKYLTANLNSTMSLSLENVGIIIPKKKHIKEGFELYEKFYNRLNNRRYQGLCEDFDIFDLFAD